MFKLDISKENKKAMPKAYEKPKLVNHGKIAMVVNAGSLSNSGTGI